MSHSVRVDLNRSTVSRYIQLATLFRRRIDAGVWVEGSRIPTIDELAVEYGVARATIRQALDQVEDEGYIERFRAKGTFVRKPAAPRTWCDMETDWGGLMRPSEGYVIEVLDVAQESTPPRLPDGAGSEAPAYHYVRRRHSFRGKVFLISDIHLDSRLWPAIAREDLSRLTTLGLVTSVPGMVVRDARQTMTVGAADVEVADALSIPLNAPIAHVTRIATDDQGVVALLGQGAYRGDMVRIEVKLQMG